MTILSGLQALWKLFEPDGSWRQGDYAGHRYTVQGNEVLATVGADSERANCFCLAGGIDHITTDKQLRFLVRHELAESLGVSDIVTWNDDPMRSHDDVRGAIARALLNFERQS